MVGKLKIVASQDLGKLGSKEGKSVVYDWKWYYSASSLTLWLLLVSVLVLVKANRNPRAWLIFIPLLAVNLCWTVLKKIIPLPSSAMPMFDQLFASLTMGISVLWLLGHKLGNRNRFITFLLALVTMAVLCVVGALSYSGLAFSQYTIGSVVIFSVLTLVMLLAFVFAGYCCRKRYSNLRFMLWLAVWTVAVCMVIILGYFGIAVIIMNIMGNIPSMWIFMLLQVFVTGLVLGGCLYVIMLPFMILALRSSFFRERFFACLRLKSMPTTVSLEAEASRPSEQTPSEIPEHGDSL